MMLSRMSVFGVVKPLTRLRSNFCFGSSLTPAVSTTFGGFNYQNRLFNDTKPINPKLNEEINLTKTPIWNNPITQSLAKDRKWLELSSELDKLVGNDEKMSAFTFLQDNYGGTGDQGARAGGQKDWYRDYRFWIVGLGAVLLGGAIGGIGTQIYNNPQ